MELSKRMQAVADQVPKGSIAADVGCDHGYVAIYLVQKEICPKVFSMDVRTGPLCRAKEHIRQYGLEEKIEVILSDGLKELPETDRGPAADTLVTAGMGDPLVIKILSESLSKVKRMKTLVLQPQSEVEQVRRFLPQIGYQIVAEDMIFEEGKYYPLMQARNRTFIPEEESFIPEEAQFPKEWGYLFGEQLLKEKHPVLKEFLLYRLEKNRELTEHLKTAASGQSEKGAVRLEEIRRECDTMEQILRQIYKTG